MSPFLEHLSRWRGRSHVQQALEARGYTLPRHYQKAIAASCSSEARVDLDRYWDEEAREYVCSAGHANSATREFPALACYRSQYLDLLASMREVSAVIDVSPLHPCLNQFKIRERTDPQFGADIVERMQEEKRLEIQRLKIQASLWNGQKENVGPIFERLMKEKGFTKWKRSFRKESNSGLVFGGFADLQGRLFSVTVPFHFFIADETDLIHVFEFSAQRILPGFWFYYGFSDIDAGVLGFQAYVEMIDIISRSFD